LEEYWNNNFYKYLPVMSSKTETYVIIKEYESI
jgi:hypothetical protein